MKLITRFELAAKNENELHALLREAFNDLAKSEPNTHQARAALVTLENTGFKGARPLSFYPIPVSKEK